MKEWMMKRLQLLRSCSLVILGFSLAVPRIGLGIVCFLLALILDIVCATIVARSSK